MIGIEIMDTDAKLKAVGLSDCETIDSFVSLYEVE